MNAEKALPLSRPSRAKFSTAPSALVVHAGWRWLSSHLWLLLSFFAIPALWPFYQEGLPRSFDGGLHLLRLGVLDYHIRQGVLYPRWAPTLMLGYGYPVFNFYAPSTYYVVELLHLAGFSFYTAFILAFALIVLAAGYGMYLLARTTFPDQPWCALVAATAYMYAPYLLTNVYIRGALAEACAQALLPWIFWSVARLFKDQQPHRHVLLVVLSLGGLAITHNITLLFLPPVLLAFMAIQWHQGKRSRSAAIWAGLSLLGAMGISAFFWLPLLLERSYLADTAYTIAKTVWLPSSVWTWRNFLDTGFTFTHTFDRPIRLGLVQLGLAMAGVLAAYRRDSVWVFWSLVALLLGLMTSAWALPLWLGNGILPVAQFAWRLLAILSLPLALLTGGLLCRLRSPWQPAVAVLVLGMLVFANTPRLSWMDVFTESTTDVGLPVFAQTELDKGIFNGGGGNSSIQEFRPRWVDTNLVLAPTKEQLAPNWNLKLDRGNAYDLAFHVRNSASAPFRFNTFYFPGWQVLLDQHTSLKTYPSTNLGLLTVDLPSGEHEVQLTWTGTLTQSWADSMSLITLGLLALFVWRQQSGRWLALAPGILLVCGATAFVWPRHWTPIEQPTQPVAADEIQLLGLRTEQGDSTHVYLYPYWYVMRTPSKNLRMQWQLLDAQGAVLSETLAYPYFNTVRASNWPPSTLVDDAYQLALPPGLPAGTYQIALQVGTRASDWAQPAHPVGRFRLMASVPRQAPPSNPLQAQVGDAIQLAGFTATAADRPLTFAEGKPTIVFSGDYLAYTLYWQATGTIAKNYHGFVHLTNAQGQPLVQEDHLPGPLFHPPLLWDRTYPQQDAYLLRIPTEAPSGLYWPEVGMYDFETQERLPVQLTGQTPTDDHVRLPPVKIVNEERPAPTKLLMAHFGDMATLLGYDLHIPAAGLHPGDRFAITLYYRSETTTKADYTRFLHVYNPVAGMAAQFDSPPQNGNNPTWSWVAREVIMDRVDLQVAAQAKPGPYTLYLGFYEPKANGARLGVHGGNGKPLPDNQVPLTTVEITQK